MRVAGVNLQLRVNGAAQAIMRDHAAHRALDDQLRAALAAGLEVLGVMAADDSRKSSCRSSATSFLPVTRTLPALITTTKSPVSTCGVKIGFVLAAQERGGFLRDPAQHLVLGIDHPPLALHFTGFGGKGLHVCFAERVEKLEDALKRVNSLSHVFYRTCAQQPRNFFYQIVTTIPLVII